MTLDDLIKNIKASEASQDKVKQIQEQNKKISVDAIRSNQESK